MKNRLWWSLDPGGAGEDADLVADVVGDAKAEPVDIELHAPVGVIAPEYDVPDRARLPARGEIHAAVDRPLRRQAGDVERHGFRVIGMARRYLEGDGEAFVVGGVQHAGGIAADLAVAAQLGAHALERVLAAHAPDGLAAGRAGDIGRRQRRVRGVAENDAGAVERFELRAGGAMLDLLKAVLPAEAPRGLEVFDAEDRTINANDIHACAP